MCVCVCMCESRKPQKRVSGRCAGLARGLCCNTRRFVYECVCGLETVGWVQAVLALVAFKGLGGGGRQGRVSASVCW